ncbi:MAG TPA: carboxylating nicotinate-nucleotide diphosphorylase [Bacillota bacterium]|nr:carboxylating nicotinate-nucleotide diphosphorylase [Bacillota bacterium]
MSNGVNNIVLWDEYILHALREDITSEDVSTESVMREPFMAEVDLIAKQDGILCGLVVFTRVFEMLCDNSSFSTTFKDGDSVTKGTLIGKLRGDGKALLSGERTALNFLQRMSGIATMTNDMVKELQGYNTKLLDTRKTTPNMRPFEKYAVRIGGGTNHRYNLSDGVLLKDNHIGAAGSVTNAVKMAKEYAPFVRKIEVEVESLEMLDEALAAGADIIMLDNMTDEMTREAVSRAKGKAELEASGNMSKERLRALAEIGVDFISCGALTHSAPIIDFSMKNLHPIN